MRPITSSPTIGATCPRSVQMTVSESGFQASSPWSCSRQKTCMSGSCRLCCVWFEGWWAAHEAGREEQLVLRGEGEARDAALVAAEHVALARRALRDVPQPDRAVERRSREQLLLLLALFQQQHLRHRLPPPRERGRPGLTAIPHARGDASALGGSGRANGRRARGGAAHIAVAAQRDDALELRDVPPQHEPVVAA